MDEDAIIGIAIYLATDKMNKTKKRKKRFWMKKWFKKGTHPPIIIFSTN